MSHNEKEIAESVQLLKDNPEDGVIMNLEEGDYVVLKIETYDQIVNELNNLRIEFGDIEAGIDIMIPSGEEVE